MCHHVPARVERIPDALALDCGIWSPMGCGLFLPSLAGACTPGDAELLRCYHIPEHGENFNPAAS